MLACLKSALSWLVYALPDLSSLILVLVGVIMSLPKLAQKIEDNAIARYAVGIGCLVVGLLGFGVGIYQRRNATEQMSSLVGNTNNLVTDTHNLVSTVGILLPQIAAANQGVADLKTELRAAEQKNDPKQVASLQVKLAEAQKTSDGLSRELADAAKKFNPPVVPSL